MRGGKSGHHRAEYLVKQGSREAIDSATENIQPMVWCINYVPKSGNGEMVRQELTIPISNSWDWSTLLGARLNRRDEVARFT